MTGFFSMPAPPAGGHPRFPGVAHNLQVTF
jgi:hypothetical protein